MIPREAVEKALEAGWKPTYRSQDDYPNHIVWRPGGTDVWVDDEQVALDPDFWKALGKALGWDMDQRSIWHSQSGGKMGRLDGQLYRYNSPPWHAHHFYDVILDADDTAEFWAALLATPPKSSYKNLEDASA